MGNFFLQSFDSRAFKLDDSTAVNADEVIVVGTFEHPFVILLALSEVVLLHHFFPNEKIERSVDSRLGNTPVFFPELGPKFIGGKMLPCLCGEDFLDDDFAGPSELEIAKKACLCHDVSIIGEVKIRSNPEIEGGYLF